MPSFDRAHTRFFAAPRGRGAALGLLALLACLAAGCAFLRSSTTSNEPDQYIHANVDEAEVAVLRERAQRAEKLAWLSADSSGHTWLAPEVSRSDVVSAKYDSQANGDLAGAARAAGVLAAEAQLRAARVLDRWTPRIDPETGLLPRGVAAQDQVWDYANTGADLYPHLTIAAALLRPSVSPALEQVLTAEQRLADATGLPADVDLLSDRAKNRARDNDLDDRTYGGVEYAKDGLLPLSERLGRGPWFQRMEQLARATDSSASISTPFGRIPSAKSEVNGQALQVLSRLHWATGDDGYRAAAERIARAYLELALPSTSFVPTRTWDFKRRRTSTTNIQLRDHGNEVVAGLVEFHLIQTLRGDPAVPEHRARLRLMLDRLLEVGRTPDGLWKSEINPESGQAMGYPLSDNWGYLYAAYLTQAMIEESSPEGDPDAAQRYRAAAEAGLEAAARLDAYPWQGVEQDGYADALESALYLLKQVPSLRAAAWVDRQAAVLFGSQNQNGKVDDHYLDGNFIRTALLYAAWQSHGVRMDPWEPAVMLGASPYGSCLSVAMAASRPWAGRVIFDTPRHRLHLGLPMNYPRLNEWPEWFVVEPDAEYDVDDSLHGWTGRHLGSTLAVGLPLDLAPGSERRLDVCPTNS
jgi:hypothetical protein